MQITKIKSYIGFAMRMGKVVYGLESIRRGKHTLYLVVHDQSLGNSALRSVKGYCLNHEVELLEVPYLLSEATKNDKIKLIGVRDLSLAKAIIESSKVTEVSNEQ